jgi:predicted metal-dependent phosphoesterase TrpH
VAITDHDTTDGIARAIEAGSSYGIEVIPGIELGTQINDCEIHILGYFIDYRQKWLQEQLADIISSRLGRAKMMAENLKQIYGFDILFEEILQEAKEGAVTRPHIARILIKKGYASSMEDAFRRYIGEDCPAYVGRYHLSPKEGIELITKAGGVPVLAHPGLLACPERLEELVNLGILGIEAYYSKHTLAQSKKYIEIGQKFGLVITGGTDCHGELVDGEPIIGDIRVDRKVVEGLEQLSSHGDFA